MLIYAFFRDKDVAQHGLTNMGVKPTKLLVKTIVNICNYDQNRPIPACF